MSTIFAGAWGSVDLHLDHGLILEAISEQIAPTTERLLLGTNGGLPVKGLDWSVATLGAHLGATAANYRRVAEGEVVMTVPLERRQEAIDAGLAGHSGGRSAEMADRVAGDLAGFVAAMARRDGHERLSWYGLDAPAAVVGGALLGELIVHGVDLARTHGTAVAIDDAHAAQVLLAQTSCAVRAYRRRETDVDRARLPTDGPRSDSRRTRQRVCPRRRRHDAPR